MLIQENAKQWVDTRWLLLAMLGLILVAKVAQADIYFWEDADGVIHFSNRDAPPLSELYARESTDQFVESIEIEPVDTQQARLDEARKRQEALQDKLEASLTKVDQLTREVKAAQEEAHDATIAAQQALEQVDQSAFASESFQTPVRERIVYYAVPRVYKKSPYRKGRHKLLKQPHGRRSAVHRGAKQLQIQGKGRQSAVHRGATVRPQRPHQSRSPGHLSGRQQWNPRNDLRPHRSSTHRGARAVRN